jgi:hypothetical protein
VVTAVLVVGAGVATGVSVESVIVVEVGSSSVVELEGSD